MASLRSIATCIGVSGNFSVVRDFYGYSSGVYGHKDLTTISAFADPTDPSEPGELSLLGQVKLLQGPHIHLDLIRVGIEDFTETREQEIDIAVQITRELYAPIGIGIGRVSRFFLTRAEAGGYTVIDSDCEALDLIDDWDAHGGGMDVFFVQDFATGKGGGTPDKDPEGSVVQITGDAITGIILAHELGHYMGLTHFDSDQGNLMFGLGNPLFPFEITSLQLITMLGSGFMQSGCP